MQYIVQNGIVQGIDLGARAASAPLDFVLSVKEFVDKPSLATAVGVLPFTPTIIHNIDDLRGGLRGLDNIPHLPPRNIPGPPKPKNPTPVHTSNQPTTKPCPQIDAGGTNSGGDYYSTSGKPPKKPGKPGKANSLAPKVSYDQRTLFLMLIDGSKTSTSKSIIEAIKDGSLKIQMDPNLVAAGKNGACSSGDLIRICPGLNEHTTLATLIHEGQHALDIKAGIVPPPEAATLYDRAVAEARAFGADIAYMKENTLVQASQWELTKSNPTTAWISIANSYKDFMNLSDTQFAECIDIMSSFM